MSGSIEPPRPGGATSKAPRARVLLVDDESAIRRSAPRLLVATGYAVDTAEDGAAALALLETRAVDVLLLDLRMPTLSGIEVISRVKSRHPEIEVVMAIDADDATGALESIHAGAYDVVTKPFLDADALALVIGRAADHRRLVGRVRALERRLERHERFGELVGASKRMQEVSRLARGVAPTGSTVLILGESGTGKEHVARSIHEGSGRESRPFRTLDCGAVPEPLLTMELFGSVLGAFPGAIDRPGIFEQAERGTVFLDDLGALPPSGQAGLLRILTEQAVQRAGESEARAIDVRVLAAANVDLRDRVKAGAFREDLYYRLNVFAIHLPPLRRRKEDIPLLAYHFLQKYGPHAGRDIKRISVEALRLLREKPWPGNVRELEATIEHAVVMARGEAIVPADLPAEGGDRDDGDEDALPGREEQLEGSYADAKDRVVGAFDRAYVERLLKRVSGNVSEAARLSGMDRSNFRRLIKKVERQPK
ncbi:MAG: sigma-54 dependent transcriptional regulator [Byssovorax sp.]